MDNLMLSIASILGITLLYAAPLIYTAMGGVVSENTGVVNIGLEGMMTIGAVVGAIVGFYVGNPWIAFIAAGFGGMSVALLHGIATLMPPKPAAQPTRGLDVGAIENIHNFLVQQRDRGKAVLLISFELDEVMSLSDRIGIIYEGQITKVFKEGEADQNELGYYMAGGEYGE